MTLEQQILQQTNALLFNTYLIYLVISLGVVLSVGIVLYRKGKVFPYEAFDNRELADSINSLLLIGYYLINIGYTSLVLKAYDTPQNAAEMVEILSAKLGAVLIVLGIMHFFNILIFNRFRKSKVIKPVMVRA